MNDVVQGDEDEGFDEEFEDKDNVNEAELSNVPFSFEDFDPKDFQDFLGDALLTGGQFDDLGVDIIDQEPTSSPSSVMSSCSSPYYHTPSPYQAPPPPPVFMQLQMNQYNQGEASPPERGREEVVTSGSQVKPDSTTANEESCSWFDAPNLVDLAETTRLLSVDTFDFSTVLSSEASVDTQSMYMFGIGTGELTALPNTSPGPLTVPQNHVATPETFNGHVTVPESHVTTLMDSSMFTDSSEMESNPHNLRREASPHTPVTPSFSPSPSPVASEPDILSEEDKALIEMPYYKFRKLLDDPSIPETRKESIKNVRRRGRNKMAAKVCRKKKLNMIMGLEQEIELLRKTKLQMSMKSKVLEKEISELKRQYHCNRR